MTTILRVWMPSGDMALTLVGGVVVKAPGRFQYTKGWTMSQAQNHFRNRGLPYDSIDEVKVSRANRRGADPSPVVGSVSR